MTAKKVKPNTELRGGTFPLSNEGVELLNDEIEQRHEWYLLFGGKAPFKQPATGKYTPEEQAQSKRHEAAKRRLVIFVSAIDFRDMARLIGYSPEYRKGRPLA